MFVIDINYILSTSITMLIFMVIVAFDTVFLHIDILEKESLKEGREDVKKKVDKFLNNIIWYRIGSNLAYILLLAYYFRVALGNVFFRHYALILFIAGVVLLTTLQTIIKVYSKINVYNTFVSLIDYVDTILFVLYPLVMIFSKIYHALNNRLNEGKEFERRSYTEEDIRHMVSSANDMEVEEEEKEMIHSIFNLSDTTVKEIMTPRTSIFALDKDKKLDDVWDLIIECGFSRIPIYNENIDDIIGILNTKELFKYRKENTNMKLCDLVSQVSYVPESKLLIDMLEYFKRNQQHMAIIIDEYGGTLGLITIEDLLEEIVGEIRDEYDIEEENFKKISNNVYEIIGETLVEEVNDEFDLELEESEEYDTISGYIQDKLEKVAEVNDKIIKEKYIIQVLKVSNKKIEKVKLVIKE